MSRYHNKLPEDSSIYYDYDDCMCDWDPYEEDALPVERPSLDLSEDLLYREPVKRQGGKLHSASRRQRRSELPQTVSTSVPLLAPQTPPWGPWPPSKRHRVTTWLGDSSEYAASTSDMKTIRGYSPHFRRTRSTALPSVPTPRFYHRQAGKRPSRLCMPLPCRVDPEVTARAKQHYTVHRVTTPAVKSPHWSGWQTPSDDGGVYPYQLSYSSHGHKVRKSPPAQSPHHSIAFVPKTPNNTEYCRSAANLESSFTEHGRSHARPDPSGACCRECGGSLRPARQGQEAGPRVCGGRSRENHTASCTALPAGRAEPRSRPRPRKQHRAAQAPQNWAHKRPVLRRETPQSTDTAGQVEAPVHRRQKRNKPGSSVTSLALKRTVNSKLNLPLLSASKRGLLHNLSTSNLSGEDLQAVISARSKCMEEYLNDLQNSFGVPVTKAARRGSTPAAAKLTECQPKVPEEVRSKLLTQEHLVHAYTVSTQALAEKTAAPAGSSSIWSVKTIMPAEKRASSGDSDGDGEAFDGLVAGPSGLGGGTSIEGTFNCIFDKLRRGAPGTVPSKPEGNTSSSIFTATVDPRQEYEGIYKNQSSKSFVSKSKLSKKNKQRNELNFREILSKPLDKAVKSPPIQKLWAHDGSFEVISPDASRTEQDARASEVSKASSGTTVKPSVEVKFEERWSSNADPNLQRPERDGAKTTTLRELKSDESRNKLDVTSVKSERSTNINIILENGLKYKKIHGKLGGSSHEVPTQEHQSPTSVSQEGHPSGDQLSPVEVPVKKPSRETTTQIPAVDRVDPLSPYCTSPPEDEGEWTQPTMTGATGGDQSAAYRPPITKEARLQGKLTQQNGGAPSPKHTDSRDEGVVYQPSTELARSRGNWTQQNCGESSANCIDSRDDGAVYKPSIGVARPQGKWTQQNDGAPNPNWSDSRDDSSTGLARPQGKWTQQNYGPPSPKHSDCRNDSATCRLATELARVEQNSGAQSPRRSNSRVNRPPYRPSMEAARPHSRSPSLIVCSNTGDNNAVYRQTKHLSNEVQKPKYRDIEDESVTNRQPMEGVQSQGKWTRQTSESPTPIYRHFENYSAACRPATEQQQSGQTPGQDYRVSVHRQVQTEDFLGLQRRPEVQSWPEIYQVPWSRGPLPTPETWVPPVQTDRTALVDHEARTQPGWNGICGLTDPGGRLSLSHVTHRPGVWESPVDPLGMREFRYPPEQDQVKLENGSYKFWEESSHCNPNTDSWKPAEFSAYCGTDNVASVPVTTRTLHPSRSDEELSSARSSRSYLLELVNRATAMPSPASMAAAAASSSRRCTGSLYPLRNSDLPRSMTNTLLGCTSATSAASCGNCHKVAKQAKQRKEYRRNSLKSISKMVSDLEKLERVPEEVTCREHSSLLPTST